MSSISKPQLGFLFLLSLCSLACADEPTDNVLDYDIAWDSPSVDALGSMPLGNGDIAVNAWIEPCGELVFTIGKTDAWGENGRLLKLGKIRVAWDPPAPTRPFQQVLHLQDGTITVRYGERSDSIKLKLWVDANHPTIHVEVNGTRPRTATASIESWRTEPTPIPKAAVSDLFEDRSKPHNLRRRVVVQPDSLLHGGSNSIGWYHHNRTPSDYQDVVQVQGLAGYFAGKTDPLLDRVFGAVITTAADVQPLDDAHLRSPQATDHIFSVHVLTEHPSSPDQWRQSMDELIRRSESIAFADRRAAHVQWWQAFWDRSWIHVVKRTSQARQITSGNVDLVGVGEDPREDKPADDVFIVSRAYALQRFIDACAGRGRYPIKFNGSLFNVAYENQFGNADYRRWGPGYWWQNTRLPYLSMCTSGDFEMMLPLFRMYADDLMALHEYRTKKYTGHAGAFIPECIYFWGGTFAATYGWTPFDDRGEDKLQESGWHKREWVSGLELVWMMLDYFEHTEDDAFLRDTLLPAANPVLTFFDQHYQVDQHGKLVMQPSQSLETWWDCTNPMPEVAGLWAVTGRLLALPERLVSPTDRAFWRQLKTKIPELPTREGDGVKMLAPAARFNDKRNVENPELYAVFPFRLVSFDKPNAPLGIQALNHRADRGNFGWRQDDLFMTHLGRAEEAREFLVGRAKNTHSESRFPAFWGPNYDWVPDQDHGGVLMRALQSMLMQTESKTIHLLPAWPKQWDANFKLHAPYRTIVSGRVRDGEIEDLKVEPTSRRGDVVVHGANDK